jgi:hypothetical protein
MRHTTISGQHNAHHAIAVAVWVVAALWIVAGIVAVIALGGGVMRMAVVLAVVATEWWLIPQVEHRFERKGGKTAGVSHLRPVLTSQRDLKTISAYASSPERSAA